MVASEAPEWLPSGWTVQVKVHNYGRKVKQYCNVETGQKFYSKKEVIEYIEQNASQSTPQPSSKQSKTRSNNTTAIVEKTNENPEWLPHGWITEVKIKSGSGKPYKCYIDPESGSKFYSKPEVSRYLESVNTGNVGQKKTSTSPSSVIKPDVDGVTGGKSSSKKDTSQSRKSDRSKNCITKQEDKQQEVGIGKPSIDNVLTERGTPDELPPGWIKDIKTRKTANGIRKYPYYTDPVSGYVFSSKKDALRYVETGSIDSCAVKPKKRDTNDQELTSGKILHNSDQSEKDKPSSSKPDESPNVKSIKNKSGIHKQENVALGEPSTNHVGIERDSPDELPPGWMKEIKTMKSGKRARKYMQYTDPLSGYMFSSKRDALRYLETGDIGSCATKPRKRDTDDPELINGKISAIIHSLTGLESFLEPDVPQNGNTVKSKSGTSEQEKVDSTKPSIDKAVNESGSTDELPPGWIIEIKTKKSGNRTRKYQYYVEPSTGYVFSSKKDALRYVETGDINKCAVKPKKRETNNPELINANVSIDEKIDEVITNSKIDEKRDEVTIANSKIDDKTDEVPEWLPSGWTMELKTKNSATPKKYKCYIDPSTGRKFYSKPEVSRYLKTLNIGNVEPKDKGVGPVSNDNLTGGQCSSIPDNSQDCKPIESKICTAEKEEVEVDKPSINDVSIERGSTGELPPGWIKEIRTKKVIKGIRKDPYYIDPLSGYEFRSLKDALRYVETGDISQCAIKPRKRDINEPKLTNGNISSPSSVEAKEASHRTTRRQVSAGKEGSGIEIDEGNQLLDANGSSYGTKESSDSKTKGSKRKRGMGKSAENATEKSAENETIATPATTKGSKRTQGKKVSAEKASISTPPTTQLSKRKRGTEVSFENGSVSTTTDIVHEEKLPENVIARSVNRKTQVDPSKPKKKRALLMTPTRTSKRLVGLEPDTPINLVGLELGTLGFSEVGIGGASHGATEVLEGEYIRTSKRHVVLEPDTPINLGFSEVGTGGAPHGATEVLEVEGEYTCTSKRLVGLEPNTPINLGFSEVGTGGAPHGATEVVEAEPEREIAPHAYAEILSAELLNKIEKALEEHAAIVEKTENLIEDQTKKPLEQQAVTEEQQETPLENRAVTDEPTEKPFEHQAVIYELIEKPLDNQAVTHELAEKSLENRTITGEPTEKRIEEKAVIVSQNYETAPPGMQNPQVFYPMMDSWSDPCLEFAFKTLTGALPVEDNTGAEGYYQHQVEPPSHTPDNGGLASFPGLPNYYQNPFSLNLNEPHRPVPVAGPTQLFPGPTQLFPGPTQQFPGNPTYMPSGSNNGTQQTSSLDPGKQRMWK